MTAVQWYYAPVSAHVSFSNSWGAPRSGGRTHKGTDVMAKAGSPAVAVCAGTVTHVDNDLGGYALMLHGVDGNSYYYAHLYDAGRIPNGTKVNGGAVIGYVDSSGNAAGGAPHLHFGIKPGGKGNINPYNFLMGLYNKGNPINGVQGGIPTGVIDSGLDDSEYYGTTSTQVYAGMVRAAEVVMGFLLVVVGLYLIGGKQWIDPVVNKAKMKWGTYGD